MKFKHTVLLAGTAVTVPVCSAWIRACLHDVPCLTGFTDPHMRTLVIVTNVFLLIAFTGVAMTIRALWLIVHTVRATRELPRQRWPRVLEESVRRTRTRRVECIASDISVAFCAGGLRPRIYVSAGLLRRLGAEEMDAVLLHEDSHSRWRDPLWLTFMHAAADVCFMYRWWPGLPTTHAKMQSYGQIGTRSATLGGGHWLTLCGPQVQIPFSESRSAALQSSERLKCSAIPSRLAVQRSRCGSAQEKVYSLLSASRGVYHKQCWLSGSVIEPSFFTLDSPGFGR